MMYSQLLSVFIAARMFTGSLRSNDDSSVVIEMAHMSQCQQGETLGNRLLTVWLFVNLCSHISSFAAICTEINMPEIYHSLSLLTVLPFVSVCIDYYYWYQ
jgi:hypothetical protein